MTTELWNAKRKKLESKLVEAALSLSEHTGSHGFSIPVPGTTPAVSVSIGALTASGGNAAPVDPNVQGMADCMDMVRQELIEAGVIGPGIAPMFIASAVMARLAAASAPNAALVAALKAVLLIERGSSGRIILENDDETAIWAALSAAGQEVKP